MSRDVHVGGGDGVKEMILALRKYMHACEYAFVFMSASDPNFVSSSYILNLLSGWINNIDIVRPKPSFHTSRYMILDC